MFRRIGQAVAVSAIWLAFCMSPLIVAYTQTKSIVCLSIIVFSTLFAGIMTYVDP